MYPKIKENRLFDQNKLKNYNFPLHTLRLVLETQRKSAQKCMRQISCSEFNQVSGGLIHFWWRSRLMGEKCQQSGPIGNHHLKKFIYNRLTLFTFFTHKMRLTAKMHERVL